MLEVMNAGSMDLSCTGDDHSMLLNCWNKTSPLIKELERTVNFAERKCGDLMQQLHFYKKYYEKWAQFERVSNIYNKKKEKKCCRQTPDFNSSSENEFEKANRYLYKKIKSKINEMNNEITQANRKIHSKTENFVQSLDVDTLSYLQPEENLEEANDPPFSAIPNKSCKSEPLMKSSNQSCDLDLGGIKITQKNSSNSVPVRSKVSKNIKKDSRPPRRRYASLQKYKIRSKSLPQGVRRKFGFGGFFEVFEPDRRNINSRSKSKTSLKTSSCKSKKSKTRLGEVRKLTPKSSRLRLTRSRSDIRHNFVNAKSEPVTKKHEGTQQMNVASQATTKEINTCTSIVPSNSIKDVTKTEFALCDSLKILMTKPNILLPFLQNPIPFIPCSSTSKSFNLGLNVQQVLSLIKRKRHSVTLQAIVRNSMQAARSITEPTVNTLFISQTTTSHSHVTSAICPAKEASEDGFSVVTDNRSKCSILKQVQTMRSQISEGKLISPREEIEVNKVERPEDVWVVEQPDPRTGEIRNSRSKCTCFPSKHCVEYNKVLKQYTGWRLPSDNPSSFICTKSKLCSTPSKDNINFSGREHYARTEVMKVHNDLLNLSRKYTTLQKQITQNRLDDYEAKAEIDAMESELALKEVEFNDILSFYNQLIALKEKLKSLRTRVRQGQERQPECQRPKKNPLRPTPSMALAKVLKKIQGLQDKIKLIDAP